MSSMSYNFFDCKGTDLWVSLQHFVHSIRFYASEKSFDVDIVVISIRSDIKVKIISCGCYTSKG